MPVAAFSEWEGLPGFGIYGVGEQGELVFFWTMFLSTVQGGVNHGRGGSQ